MTDQQTPTTATSPSVEADLPTIVDLCKKRGIIFPSSEIYGGLRSTWDYGPLGVELKENVKREWWRTMVQLRDDIVGLDAAILMHPKVWEASGHLESFADPLVECVECHKRFRADHLMEDLGAASMDGVACPSCGGRLTDPKNFNLMFKTFHGPLEDDSAVLWMRPETAQGMFVDFPTIQRTSRLKVPFGIAQMGKSFRNEITPGNFIFRTREFEQMEMQFFVEPGTDEEWLEYWMDRRLEWVASLGVDRRRLRLQEHAPDELAHYAKRAFDIQYEFPFGWQEFEGIHNRTDFDLRRHQEYSGKKLEYVDPVDRVKRYVPYIIETSAGADRTLLVVLADAYREEEVEGERRVVLALHPRLAPLKAAVFPLVKKDGMPELAVRIREALNAAGIPAFYDDSGSIGRRYRRQDEAGTPFGITVDGQSMEDATVTVRDRDTLEQERVAVDRVVDVIRARVA